MDPSRGQSSCATAKTAQSTSHASSSAVATSSSKFSLCKIRLGLAPWDHFSNCLFVSVALLVYSSTVYLYTANDPIIEASTGLRFAPFNIGYPKLREHAEVSGNTTENKWELVFDFSSAGGEKNFSMVSPEEFSTELLEIPGYEGTEKTEIYYEIPKRYGGILSDEKPKSSGAEESTFSINTSAHEAQAIVDQER